MCSVEACDRKHYALTWCRKHYDRVRRTGGLAVRPGGIGWLSQYINPKMVAKESPTLRQIALAAGWYEGEGSCSGKKTTNVALHAVVGQKDPWMLERLRNWFGGSIYDYPAHPERVDRWVVNGNRARGFLLTIYAFLSPRRQKQIRAVIYR